VKKLVENTELTNQFDWSLPGIVSTDVSILDWALGGGLPLGRQISIYGGEGIGKTSSVLWFASRYTNSYNGKVYYEEGEGKPPLGEHVLKSLGFKDLSRIITRRPNNVATLLSEVEHIGQENEEACIIIDSIASFGQDRGKYGTKDYINVTDNAQVANSASKYNFFMQGPFPKIISTKKILFLVVNQIRDNVGSRFGGVHTPGGHSPKHLDSVTIKVSKEEGWRIEDSDKNLLGQNITYKIEKNMIGAPYREAVVPFYYSYGFDPEESLLVAAYEKGIVKISGGWYIWGVDENGKPKNYRKSDLVNLMRQDRKVYTEILEKVMAKLG
jgi:recombination protein RecA